MHSAWPATDFPQQIVQVERGDVIETLSVAGQMKFHRQVVLAFSLPAGVETRLLTLSVQSGQQVSMGDLLASIDAAPLQRALEAALIEEYLAQMELAKLSRPTSEVEVSRAYLAVAKARLDLQRAEQKVSDILHPPLDELAAKVIDAEHALALAELDQDIASKRETVGKRLRDLEYSLSWHSRRLSELGELVKSGRANREQQLEYERVRQIIAELQDEFTFATRQAEWELLMADRVVREKADALLAARQELAKAQAGPDPAALAIAQLDVKAAEIALQRAEEHLTTLKAGPKASTIAQAQAEMESRTRAVQSLQSALERVALRAPFAGVIIDTPARIGDPITSQTVVVVLADLSSLRPVAFVDEIDIHRLWQGMPATISLDAFPERQFAGQVGTIPLQSSPDTQSGRVYFEVPIEFEYGDLPLKPDMSAIIRLELRRASGVLRLPTIALRHDGTNVTVLRQMPSGEVRSVAVTVGLSDGLYAEIVSGLQEGDRIIVPATSVSAR